MITENHMVMELFWDDPNGENGVFEVFSDFNVLKGFEDGQETKLRLLVNAMECKVVF